MRHKIIYILLSVVLLLTTAASAQTLTLQQCREMAISSNRSHKSSGERILMAEDMLSAYKTYRLPDFSLKGSYLYASTSLSASISGGYLPIITSGVMSSDSFAYMPDQNYDLKIGSVWSGSAMATQPIYMGRKISNAIKLASVGVKISTLDRQRSEAEVLQQVDNAFYKIVELEELLLTAQRYESVVAELHKQMQSGYDVGMKTRNDLMKISVRLSEAELQTLRATNGVRLAKMNLCYAVGLPLSTEGLEIVNNDTDVTVIDESSLDITSRPEWAILNEQLEAKRLEAKITRGDFRPSVVAVGAYGYTNGVTINGSKLINNASFAGGVTINVPIFHWGEGRRKSSAKEREITIAQNQLEDMGQLMTLELMQAINIYNESILEVHHTENALQQAEENMRMSKNQYNAGMETLTDYLESQALWQKAMSDLCTAKSQQRCAHTSYLKCRGALVVK